MSPDYEIARLVCREALRVFRDEINDYLPEYHCEKVEDEEYLYPWDTDSIQEVYDIYDRLSGKVLSTVMANHFTYELMSCKRALRDAVKERSISAGQYALRNIMEELGFLSRALKALP